DGAPFTAEDFRYWWEDVLNHPELRPMGLPAELLVEGEAPTFEVPGPHAVRYTWTRPNPGFLPSLADARAIELFGPAHYLKPMHPRYADPKELAERVEASGRQGWAHLHNALDNARNNDNPDLPSLQPWVPVTRPPAGRFVFERNPFYHRVDPEGRQLPYIDRVSMLIADSKLIPAKTGAGEADLQARYLQFNTFPVLKVAEERNGLHAMLWQTGVGSRLALYPNLTHADPVWRAVLRDPRFRRALSLGIDRDEINQVVYFGLGQVSNNTMTRRSPLWRKDHQFAWTEYRPEESGRLLDEMGLAQGPGGTRLLPDGRPLHIVVETAGTDTEETDVLQLIADGWRRLGIRIFPKTMRIDVLRNRIYAGETVVAIATGLENAIATPDMSPAELAPVDQGEYQWPRWGQYVQTGGKSGEAADLPEAVRLLELLKTWREAPDTAGREAAWQEMLAIHADQQFTIGLVNGTLQPVVIRAGLRNVPEDGIFNWDPGAHFGIYNPDTFWFEED
ncbi:MAG TPA: ABC transporter substrate-binding protein, partial [Arenibaculum sp.]|nr:ABC transporter substrate-binding protein [Arenibaculum sp.]